MGPTINVTELNKKFVVFKRVKKRNWYYRGGVVTTRHARNAVLYSTEAEAQTQCNSLNVGRKAYKFKVQTAAKHFCSAWRVSFDTWNNQLRIHNELVAFNDIIDKKIHVNSSLNAQKDILVKALDQRLTYLQAQAAQAEQEYLNDIAAAQKELENKRASFAQTKIAVEQHKQYVVGTDFDKDFVEKYQTDLDKKAIILFGKGHGNV